MKNIKHRKFTTSSLTSLACFNVIRQQWAANGAFSPGSSSSCCHLTLPRRWFCRDPSWHKKDETPLWRPSSSRAASQRGHCNGKHVPHPGLTDHTIHAGTSGMAKPHEQRRLWATHPTSATDPAASMRKQCSYNSTPLQISIWSQQSMRSFLLILSVDYFKFNLKEKYSKIECNMV